MNYNKLYNFCRRDQNAFAEGRSLWNLVWTLSHLPFPDSRMPSEWICINYYMWLTGRLPSFIYLFVCLKMITLSIYSHILVAPGVGFLLLCVARGSASRGVGVLNQSKNSIILKNSSTFACLLNKWVAALFICLCVLEVSSVGDLVPIYSLFPGFWQSFISIEVCRDCIPALASSCKKQLTGFFVCLLFFLKVKRIS